MEVYQFIKQIGQGRYGDVWLVKGSKTRRNYVLKQIDLHQVSKREQKAAQSEAKLLCTIRHPNIVTYLDSFYNSKGSLFIVMKCCEHGNLHDFIKNRKGIYFEEEEIINLFVQICMALKYLHDQSILHRDIKTENIFLTKQGLIKVGDFGIAHIFNAFEKMSPILVASPCYTSPEVHMGGAFSPKSDVWSLGCCLYEIATLKYAFIAQDISLSMSPIIKAKVSKIPNIYSSDLVQVTLSMLNLLSEKRPTVTELLLNDYIRKHILLFIRDSSHRSHSSQSGSLNAKSVASSENNIETCCSAFGNNGIDTNVKRKIREGVFKTIPDINGNGDGNDNSQQDAFRCEKTANKLKSHSDSNLSKSALNSFNKPMKNALTVRENNNSDIKDFVLRGSRVINPNPFEKRLNLCTQKLRSENSFKFLNTLTNTINVARFKSLDSFGDGCVSFPKLTKTKYNYGENPPKSAENLFSSFAKTDLDLLRRPATSAEENFGAMVNYVDRLTLPIINKHSDEVNESLKTSCVGNLPPLWNSELSFCEKVKGKNDGSFPNLEDSVVDKFLVSNIMECNKITQSDSAANDTFSYVQERHNSNEALTQLISRKEVPCQEQMSRSS